jgi:hypothetical protein
MFDEHTKIINRSKEVITINNQAITKKRSLGKLRVALKTKERSPHMTGTLCLQRHTTALILKAFENTDDDEAVCNIAAWVNHDHDGEYLTVELSPRYAAPDPQSPPSSRLAFIFDNEEDRN